MPSSNRTSWLITAFFALGLASAGQAQTTTPAADSPAAEPAPAPNPVVKPVKIPTSKPRDPTPSYLRHPRVMSSTVAGALANSMPKYDPPKPLAPKPEEESPDLRDTDKPKNTIVRLPTYVVKEEKPPIFTERQMHTKKELAEIAMKRYAGLRFGNVFGLNEPIALLMYQEQERLDNMAELAEDAKNARNSGDSAGADSIARERDRAYYRPSDIGGSPDAGGH